MFRAFNIVTVFIVVILLAGSIPRSSKPDVLLQRTIISLGLFHAGELCGGVLHVIHFNPCRFRRAMVAIVTSRCPVVYARIIRIDARTKRSSRTVGQDGW